MTPILLALLLTSQDYHATLPASVINASPLGVLVPNAVRVGEPTPYLCADGCNECTVDANGSITSTAVGCALKYNLVDPTADSSHVLSQEWLCAEAKILFGSRTYELRAKDGVLTCKDGEVVKVEENDKRRH